MVWHQTIDRGEVRIVEAHIHAAFVSTEGRPTRIPTTCAKRWAP
jgi:acyl-CoA thioesterase FadM